MKIKRLLTIIILTITLSSCFKKEKQSINNEVKKIKIEEKPQKNEIEIKYCFIKKIVEKDEKNYVVADYVDFLTDEKAIEKAKQNGDADYDIDKKGDTIYFVYNDYYVSNINPKLRTLELISDAKIELWNYPQENGIFNKVTISELKEHLSDEPIMILKIKNGIVIEMREQYLP